METPVELEDAARRFRARAAQTVDLRRREVLEVLARETEIQAARLRRMAA